LLREMQKKQNQMTVLGIDGCRYGWCVAAFKGEVFDLSLKLNLDDIVVAYPDLELALIDMPVGLGDKSLDRDLEQQARKELTPLRHQSIFTPPVREAVNAHSYTEAKKINYSITGKKISIQSWNIAPKIAELDRFLLKHPEFKEKIFESHPEICFKYLNQGVIPTLSKSAPKNSGIIQRLDILRDFQENIMGMYEKTRENFTSSGVKNDDIVDAICLAIVAKLGCLNRFEKTIGTNKTDAQGIDMAMYYYNPLPHH
jgi:predicted RNase H-like nuclease